MRSTGNPGGIGNLKSNMDRFIVLNNAELPLDGLYLKSNMDRFIVREQIAINFIINIFKIQYG